MEFRNTISCKNKDYLVTIKAVSDELSVFVSDSGKESNWSGEFTSNQIEDLASKAGSSKSFTTFCKLLVSALQGKNPALHVDFYSYQDLENIRNGSNTLTVSTRPSKKKYLIVSYLTDFEKAHYPLPLLLDDHIDYDSQVSKPVSEVSETSKLKHENHILQKKIRNFQEEFSTYRENSESKIEELNIAKAELENEIQRMKEELDAIISQLEEEAKKRVNNNSQDVKILRSSLNREKEENAILRSELSNSRMEIDFLRQSDASNKRLIEVLNKKLEESKELSPSISVDSPRQSHNFESLHSSSDMNEFKGKVNILKQILKQQKY